MSVKKQSPSLSKLYTINEEVPESFLDETDVDSYFYHNILDLAPTEKILLSNYFSFATWKINKDSLLKRKCQFH